MNEKEGGGSWREKTSEERKREREERMRMLKAMLNYFPKGLYQ